MSIESDAHTPFTLFINLGILQGYASQSDRQSQPQNLLTWLTDNASTEPVSVTQVSVWRPGADGGHVVPAFVITTGEPIAETLVGAPDTLTVVMPGMPATVERVARHLVCPARGEAIDADMITNSASYVRAFRMAEKADAVEALELHPELVVRFVKIAQAATGFATAQKERAVPAGPFPTPAEWLPARALRSGSGQGLG